MRTAALLTALWALTTVTEAKNRCHPDKFSSLEVFGVEILDIQATEREEYAAWDFAPQMGLAVEPQPISFCNITVSYTHPGQNDTITTWVWLPLDNADWNGRYLSMGGGGYMTGSPDSLPASVAKGYATAATDGGHTVQGDGLRVGLQSDWWSLLSPGNANWVLIQDFASRALEDLPKIAKQIVKMYYETPAKYSYWNGCSTGGRQGLMAAQRFPEEYDGIMAAAPAINWATFVIAEMWAVVKMNEIGYCPPQCESMAIREAAIKHCDKLDGVEDGIVAAAGLCDFDAKTVVGQKFDCEGDSRKISAEAAEIMNAFWTGPSREGKQGWYGFTHETHSVAVGAGAAVGTLGTLCDSNNKNCRPSPFPIGPDYVTNMVMKDPDFDAVTMTEEVFWKVLHRSRNEFGTILDTSDADLSEFKARGGKMITWHGLADQLIMVNGSSHYYNRVEALDADVRDFYRYFEAPGVFHCYGGEGALPLAPLEAVVKWVEEGVAPDFLLGKSIELAKVDIERPLCPYPLVAAYKGGDSRRADSFECAEDFTKYEHLWDARAEL